MDTLGEDTPAEVTVIPANGTLVAVGTVTVVIIPIVGAVIHPVALHTAISQQQALPEISMGKSKEVQQQKKNS